MIKLILETCPTTIDEVIRCLDKATIIVYVEDMFLVADDRYIYYFGTTSKNKKTRRFYKFYKEVEKLMEGKYFYGKNLEGYKNHCKETIYKGLYKWL